MIFVEFVEVHGVLCLSIEGHAETAPEGEDLVCAAASTLAYTAAYSMEKMSEEGKFKGGGEFIAYLEQGDYLLVCTPKPEPLAVARLMLMTVLYGFYALKEAFPDAVSVNIEKDEEVKNVRTNEPAVVCRGCCRSQR